MLAKIVKGYDWLLVAAAVVLSVLGMVMIYSTTGEFGVESGNTNKQLIFFLVSLAMMFLVSFFDYRILRSYAWLIYVMSFFSLVALLVFGSEIRGAVSWFQLGPVNIQPAEFAKLAVVIILAKYFSAHYYEMKKFRHIVISGIYVAVPVGLTMMQPDFGTAALMIFIWMGMLVFAGIRKTHFLILLAVGVGAFLMMWRFFLRGYQKARVEAFLGTGESVENYNVEQAKIAIGSGGWVGKGIGYGSQSQLNFLPEKHTDFIFSVLVEELGFGGSLFLVAAFAFLVYRVFRVATIIKDSFGSFMVVGVGMMILTQFFLNISINIGILPVTGVALPFVSYGGSGLLVMFLALGLVLSAYMRQGGKIDPTRARSEELFT